MIFTIAAAHSSTELPPALSLPLHGHPDHLAPTACPAGAAHPEHLLDGSGGDASRLWVRGDPSWPRGALALGCTGGLAGCGVRPTRGMVPPLAASAACACMVERHGPPCAVLERRLSDVASRGRGCGTRLPRGSAVCPVLLPGHEFGRFCPNSYFFLNSLGRRADLRVCVTNRIERESWTWPEGWPVPPDAPSRMKGGTASRDRVLQDSCAAARGGRTGAGRARWLCLLGMPLAAGAAGWVPHCLQHFGHLKGGQSNSYGLFKVDGRFLLWCRIQLMGYNRWDPINTIK